LNLKKNLALLISVVYSWSITAVASEADNARAIVEQALARCRSITTYQDRVTVRLEQIPKRGFVDTSSMLSQSGSLLFARPERFVLKGEMFSVYCDGEKEWKVVERLGQYTESPMPSLSVLLEQQSLVFNLLHVHPVAVVLAQPDKQLAELFPSVREFTAVQSEIRGTTLGQRVTGKMAIHTVSGEQITTFSLWFSATNGALRELRIDVTEGYKSQRTAATSRANSPAQLPDSEKVELVACFDNVVLNAEISPEQFTFKPGPAMRKVAKFDPQASLGPVVTTKEPTTPTLDAPLEEIASDQLVELSQNGGKFWGGTIQGYCVDVDGDGQTEFVLPEYDSGLCIIPTAGGDLRHLRLKGLEYPTRLAMFEPVRIAGKLHWLTALDYRTTAGSSQKAVLYNIEGEPVWSYEPHMPNDHGCDLLVTAGDLNGDGNIQFVLGLRASKLHKMEGQSYGWVSSPIAAYIAVLNSSGKLVAQRQVGKRLDLIHVLPSNQPNRPATIVWVAEGKLSRFQFVPLQNEKK